MSHKTKCWLKSIDNKSIKILLEDNIEVKLGRCPDTNITDKRCSRNQGMYVSSMLVINLKAICNSANHSLPKY